MPPSYVGEVVTGRCPECGGFDEIAADRDLFGEEGFCSGPEGKEPCGIVRWEVWDGPVVPI